MSDSPNQPESLSEEPRAPKPESAPSNQSDSPTGDTPAQKAESPVKPVLPKAPSKPAAKPAPTAPAADPQPSPAQQPTAQQPVTPKKPVAAKKTSRPSNASITFDDDKVSDRPSTPMLVLDVLAAAVAITFTVLILRDVMPFL